MDKDIKTEEYLGKIEMISIESLLELSNNGIENNKPKYTFFIPGYQRGYRWTGIEVNQLLEDIQEFTDRKTESDAKLYCLQPVVVKEMDVTNIRLQDRAIEGERIYELIDGQQRLTTIYLILKWLNARYKSTYQKQLFQIIFETRKNSELYLKTLNEYEKGDNIDFSHIFNAYTTIDTWFKNKTQNQKHIGELETIILKYVKPIWYEVPENSKSVEVFRALNVGKIRLTNFELIKALFLSKGNGIAEVNSSELFEIAYDWELITKALMNDSFWYFINNSKVEKFQRIDFLFEIESLSFDNENISKDEKLRTFLLFQNQLKDSSNRLKVWKNFKQLFLILQSWFEDRELHHLIGYLIAEKKNEKNKDSLVILIKDLRDKSLKVDGISFKSIIKDKISDTLAVSINDARYGKHNSTIRNILLLFNIVTLLEDKNSNVFFNFSEFKEKKWDIEHIKSVSSNKPEKRKDQLKWIKGILWFMTGFPFKEISKEKIETLLKDDDLKLCLKLFDLCGLGRKIGDIEFSDVYQETLLLFEEKMDEKVDNTIANLTLLDDHTNRSYGNSIFPVKRKTIIELETKGGFVPVCTKNVFLKLYNDRATNHFLWSQEDAEKYKNSIVEKVTKLIKKDDNNA